MKHGKTRFPIDEIEIEIVIIIMHITHYRTLLRNDLIHFYGFTTNRNTTTPDLGPLSLKGLSFGRQLVRLTHLVPKDFMHFMNVGHD